MAQGLRLVARVLQVDRIWGSDSSSKSNSHGNSKMNSKTSSGGSSGSGVQRFSKIDSFFFCGPDLFDE